MEDIFLILVGIAWGGALLSKYLDLDSVQAHRGAPRFLVGAVDVLSGEFKTFDSENGEISVETLLASAALPALPAGLSRPQFGR